MGTPIDRPTYDAPSPIASAGHVRARNGELNDHHLAPSRVCNRPLRRRAAGRLRQLVDPDPNHIRHRGAGHQLGTGAATTDYTAYNASASKQVATQSDTSTPSIGSQANEYVGTDTNGHSIVSLAFVQGTVICVVTMVSSSATVDATVGEAVAGNQAQKIIAANL